jgi:hypothetical protein
MKNWTRGIGEWGLLAVLTLLFTSRLAGAQVALPKVEAPPIPPGVDVFNLSLDEVRRYSALQNFELLGHSYFKIPQRTPFARAVGRAGGEIGSGFNTVRVYDGIAYLGGYSFPPTLYYVVIADVHDPQNMKVLSTIPCNAGTRCNYLRVDRERKILIFGHDTDTRGNPNQPPAGELANDGWSFYDISDPSHPKELGFVPATRGGKTHGFDIDGRYMFSCGTFSPNMTREGLQIIDYGGDRNVPKQIATWHVPGQMKGEQYGPLNRNGPDGKPQIIQCHEVVYYNDRVYLAWRDAGMLILDVKDRTKPKLLATYDFVPPFSGGFLGASHTSAPVVVKPGEHPDLLVHTDEIFDCPQGIGRILDISDVKNPEVVRGERPANVQLLSTFRIEHLQDTYDFAKKQFICPAKGGPAGQISYSTHLPWFDQRSPSLVYITWYDEGLRAINISNPSVPRSAGYFLSPRFASPGRLDRTTREVFQDPDTNLLWVTDGNGGGLMVVRYTGPMPGQPIPGRVRPSR